jgi:2-iminobutanoate/2-iminopropanoate deaminase
MRKILFSLFAVIIVAFFVYGQAGAQAPAASTSGKADPMKAAAKGDKPAAAPLKAISTENAPKVIGPYSQAIVEGGFLFAAGQIPRDPKTNTMVSGTIEQAVDRVFDNLEAVLKAEGLGWTDVVKTTVYMTKSEDFAAMNAAYAKRMGEGRPARSTVFVAGLPGGAIVEMDLIARARR